MRRFGRRLGGEAHYRQSRPTKKIRLRWRAGVLTETKTDEGPHGLLVVLQLIVEETHDEDDEVKEDVEPKDDSGSAAVDEPSVPLVQ